MFTYHPPFWSLGDWLELTLDFPDESVMRRELAPCGLAFLADIKVGEAQIAHFGTPIHVQLFGPAFTLSLRGEDAYEHLGPDERATEARATAALEHLAAFVSMQPIEWEEAAALPRPELARGEAYRATLVKADRPHARAIPHIERKSFVTDIDITHEADWVDLANAPIAPSLEDGAEAMVAATIGRRHDGSFGAIARRVGLPIPPASLLETCEQVSTVLRDAGIDARNANALARAYLLDRAEVTAWPFDAWLERVLALSLHGRAPRFYASLPDVVASLLMTFQTQRLPCLFRARAAVDEALRSVDAGTTLETARIALFSCTIDEANRSFAAAGDARRFIPIPITSVPVHLAITPEQARLLERLRRA